LSVGGGIYVELGFLLVKCPDCGREIDTPERSIENHFFHIEAYFCKDCGKRFKFLR